MEIAAFNEKGTELSNLWVCSSREQVDHISVIASSDQHITVELKINHIIVQISRVYASTNYIQRNDLWLDFANIATSNPWSVIGDFNAILGS